MGGAATGYRERSFASQDDLAIHYREYGDATSVATPLLCLAGLTRNAKDFHEIGLRYGGERRVLAMDYRGRGLSAYDPDWRNYRPEVYIRDVLHLLAAADAHRVVVIGTSLGGLLAMGLAVAQPSALAAVVLNDIGPEIDPRGIERIKGYVGKTAPMADWDEAMVRLKEMWGPACPDLSEEGWADLARKTFREGANGAPELDYDPLIRRPFAEPQALANDMWPLFQALENIPTMVIRGALSDILGAATVERMAELKPDLVRVSVPNRGHAPLLDEPECLAALDDFIARH